jgi:hypothetical protein
MNPYLQSLRTQQQFGTEVDEWTDEDEFGGMLPDVREMGFNAQAKLNTLWARHKGKLFWTAGALTTAAIGYGGWQFYQKKKEADELGAPIQGAANKKTSAQDDPFEEGEEQLNLFEIIEEPAGSQNTDNGVSGPWTTGDPMVSVDAQNESYARQMKKELAAGPPPLSQAERTRSQAKLGTEPFDAPWDPEDPDLTPYGRERERQRRLKKKKGSSAETSPWWELNGDPEGIAGPPKKGSKSEPEFLPGVKPLF